MCKDDGLLTGEGEWIWYAVIWVIRDARLRENACMCAYECLFSCKQLRLKGKEDWYPYSQNNECRNRMFGAYCTRWRDNSIVHSVVSGRAAKDIHPLKSFSLSFSLETLYLGENVDKCEKKGRVQFLFFHNFRESVQKNMLICHCQRYRKPK